MKYRIARACKFLQWSSAIESDVLTANLDKTYGGFSFFNFGIRVAKFG